MRPEAEPSTPKPPEYYETVNRKILGLIPEGCTRFLDVGCAAGALGKEIKRRIPEAVVHGIEQNPREARAASEKLDRVFEVDLEEDLSFLGGEYDVILFGDVLEHLVDPWRVLRELVGFLRPGGYAIASIPNIRYYKVVREIVFRGRFTYRSSGVLDSTHLRFFTRREMESLFEKAGLEVVAEKPRFHGANALLRFLDAVTFGRFEEFRAVQYILLGRKLAGRKR